MTGEYMNRIDVARLLNLSTATLDRLRREGRILQPTRLGKRVLRWNRAELDAWIASQATAQRTVKA